MGKKSYLAMLDPIHHQGLRLALGAFRTSPTASLYAEADESNQILLNLLVSELYQSWNLQT